MIKVGLKTRQLPKYFKEAIADMIPSLYLIMNYLNLIVCRKYAGEF